MLRAAVLSVVTWCRYHLRAAHSSKLGPVPSQKAGRVISKPAPELLAKSSCTSCLLFCSSCSWLETLKSIRGLLNQGLYEGDTAVEGGVTPS